MDSPPPIEGRARSLEDGLKQRSTPEGAEVNVHLCLGRGALPSATRGLAGEGSAVYYTQLVAVKVVAIAVRMVITMLRTLPQVELLLKVPIFVRILIGW